MLNIGLGHAIMGSYKVKINIRAKRRDQFLSKRLLAEKDRIIPPRSEIIILLLPVSLPDNRDFLFHPIVQANLTLLTHIIYHETIKVLVRNTSNRRLCISCCQRLGYVVNIYYDNYFLTDVKSAFNLVSIPLQTVSFSEHKFSYTSTPTNLSIEIRLDKRMRVYRDKHIVTLLAQLVTKNLSIWESEGFVQIPSERWMKVSLKHGWEAKISTIKPKVYPLENKARQLIDETFDKMHHLSRLKFTSEDNPFNFLVFVIWKTDTEDKKKGRAVVDVQKLNEMVFPNSYPLLFQSEIIANVQG